MYLTKLKKKVATLLLDYNCYQLNCCIAQNWKKVGKAWIWCTKLVFAFVKLVSWNIISYINLESFIKSLWLISL